MHDAKRRGDSRHAGGAAGPVTSSRGQRADQSRQYCTLRNVLPPLVALSNVVFKENTVQVLWDSCQLPAGADLV